jgi:hypothetical protein
MAAGPAWTDTGHVFTREDGQAYHPEHFSDRFDRLCTAAAVRRVRLHDTRHTAASLMLAAGRSVKVAQEMFATPLRPSPKASTRTRCPAWRKPLAPCTVPRSASSPTDQARPRDTGVTSGRSGRVSTHPSPTLTCTSRSGRQDSNLRPLDPQSVGSRTPQLLPGPLLSLECLRVPPGALCSQPFAPRSAPRPTSTRCDTGTLPRASPWWGSVLVRRALAQHDLERSRQGWAGSPAPPTRWHHRPNSRRRVASRGRPT